MTNVNIAELCRLCVNQSYYHANIFQKRLLDGNRIFDTLNAICQLNIVEGDDLPEYICIQCKCKLSDIEVFKQSSREGRIKLLSLKKKLAYNGVGFNGTTPATTDPLLVPVNVTELKQESFSPERSHPTKVPVNVRELKQESFSPERSHPTKVALVPESACFSVFCEPLQIDLEPSSESFSVFCEPLKENIQSVIDFSEDEELVCEEVEVSSVSDYCTSADDLDSESAQCIRECSLEDVHSAMGLNGEGTLGMRNLERDGMPQRIQNESAVKVSNETAGTEHRSSDNNKEISKQCRIKDVCTYKDRLRKKTRNIDEKVTDQHPKSRNDSGCRGFSNKSDCPKRPLKDSIANTSSRQKVQSLDKKTVAKPGLTRKRSKSRGNKGTKHFVCDMCGKGFHDKYHLGIHVSYHIGLRPYKCSICSKSFVTKCTLQRHNSVHVTKRPHVCRIKDACTFKGRLRSKTRNINEKVTDEHPKSSIESFWTESTVKVSKESADIENCSSDNNKEIGEQCRIKDVCTYKDRLRKKTRNIDEKVTDQHPKSGNDSECRVFSNKSDCPKKPLKDSIANISSRQKVQSLDKKTVVKPGLTRKKSKLHGNKGTKHFFCDICGKGFPNKHSLIRHIWFHIGYRPYKCSICSKSFVTNDHLLRHNSVHVTKRAHVCKECGKSFKDLCNLNIHMKVHRPFSCETCGKCFPTEFGLKLHGLVHRPDQHPKSSNDSGCRVFSNKSDCPKKPLKDSIANISSGQKVQSLDKKTVAKPGLTPKGCNSRRNTGTKRFFCDSCGKGFPVKYRLKNHMKFHIGFRPFKCSLCSKSFVTKGHLVRHNSVHVTERLYVCKKCGNSFKDLCNLNIHMKIHGPFYCKTCKKCFTTKFGLKMHGLVHLPDQHPKSSNDSGCRIFSNKSVGPKRPLKDSIANTSSRQQVQSSDKKTVVKPGLTRKRSKSHGNKGTKRFFCDLCGEGFPDKCLLVIHIWRHISFLPYKCSICSKSFLRKGDLKGHISRHGLVHRASFKQYSCSLCKMTFRLKMNLIDHIRRHDNLVVHKCPKCDKVFPYKCRLQYHMQNHSTKSPLSVLTAIKASN